MQERLLDEMQVVTGRLCTRHCKMTAGRVMDFFHTPRGVSCFCHRLIRQDTDGTLFIQDATPDLRPSCVKFASMWVQSLFMGRLLREGILRVEGNLNAWNAWYECALAARLQRGDEQQVNWFKTAGTFKIRSLQPGTSDEQTLQLRPLLSILFNDSTDLRGIMSRWVQKDPDVLLRAGLSGIICIPYSDSHPAVHFVAMLAPAMPGGEVRVIPLQSTTGLQTAVDWNLWAEWSRDLGTNSIYYGVSQSRFQAFSAPPVPANYPHPVQQYVITRSS